MRSKHTWMVCLLVQQKLARRSLSLIYMESYQLSNVFLFIFPMNTIVNFHAHQTVNEVLARQNVKKTQLTAWFDYNSVHNDGLGFTYWQFS